MSLFVYQTALPNAKVVNTLEARFFGWCLHSKNSKPSSLWYRVFMLFLVLVSPPMWIIWTPCKRKHYGSCTLFVVWRNVMIVKYCWCQNNYLFFLILVCIPRFWNVLEFCVHKVQIIKKEVSSELVALSGRK